MLSGCRRIGLQRGLRNRRSDLRSNNRQTHTHAHHTRRTMRVPNLRHWKLSFRDRGFSVKKKTHKNATRATNDAECGVRSSVRTHTQKTRGPKSRKNKSKAQARPTKIGQRAQPNPRQPRAFCGFCVTVIANSTANGNRKEEGKTLHQKKEGWWRLSVKVGRGWV